MGKYTRKTERKLIFTEENLRRARQRIANGESQRHVAASMGTVESTLRKRLKAGTIPMSLGRYKTIFTNEMEIDLANHCRDLDTRFYGIGTRGLRSLAFQYAELNGLTHRFNKEKKMAGKAWVSSFCKRQNLSLRAPEKCSLGRAMGFNRTQTNRFFTNLKQVLVEKKILPHRIFNMDESGISNVPNKIPKVFAQKGKKLVGKVVSGERGQTISIVCCMSPTGVFVPPGIIFPRKRMKPELYHGAPLGSLPMISDSGYMNSEIFIDWLKHFQKFVKSSEEDPVLLILDNHVSHRSLPSVLFCRGHYITLLSLPPHASHMMQPLDRSFFGPLKTAYSAEIDKWMTTNPGQTVNQRDVAQLFSAAYSKVATIPIAQSGFKSTGIFPYNDEIFTDEDFRPTEVTEKPFMVLNDNRLSNCRLSNDESDDEPLSVVKQKLIANRNKENVEPSTSKANEIIEQLEITPSMNIDYMSKKSDDELHISKHDNIKGSLNEDLLEVSQPSTSELQDFPPIKPSKSIVSPSQIHPLPKVMTNKTKTCKRRSQKSEIMTDSPFKNALLEKDNSKVTQSAKKKVFEDNSNLKTKKTQNQYTKKSTEEVFCPGCGAGENGDDWLLCFRCKFWWHEHCSSNDSKKIFICDFCMS